MALRKIIIENDFVSQPEFVLHTNCKKVSSFDESLQTLVQDLIETLHSCDSAVGLAAPQVGILKRVAVVDIGEGPIVLINPEIVEKSGSEVDVEGCLSYPGRWLKVERPTFVKVKAFNLKGEQLFLEGNGFLARVFCHEIDHLSGIVFLDRAIAADSES